MDTTLIIPPISVLVAGARWPDIPLHALQRCALPPLADHALLILWRYDATDEDAYAVSRAWGFEPKAEIVWVKTGAGMPPLDPAMPDMPEIALGMVSMGQGRYVRRAHERAIVAMRCATRGTFNVGDRAVRSVFFAPPVEVEIDEGDDDVEKPDAFYELVEKLGGTKATFAELFAFGRRTREGWHSFTGDATASHFYRPKPTAAPEPTPVSDAWARAEQRSHEELTQNKHVAVEPAEVPRLPRHKIRRPDGKIVPACCLECNGPQYAAASGVTCPAGHDRAASIPGCEFCGFAVGHKPGCEASAAQVVDRDVKPPNVVVEAPPAAAPPSAEKPAPPPPPPPAAAAKDAPPPPPPYVTDVKRDILLSRAELEGLLSADDIGQGAEDAWIKLQYRAPPGWFPRGTFETAPNGAVVTTPLPAPGEPPIGFLVRDLNTKGLFVSLPEVCKWSTTRRDVARAWLAQGGDLPHAPDWLAALATPPKHPPECANGCIGADAGCPAARHAWERLMPEEVVSVPAENMGELARAPSRSTSPAAAPVKAATPAPTPTAPDANGKRKGPGRPPGAKNKPKDLWALATRATKESADPEVEEGFFS